MKFTEAYSKDQLVSICSAILNGPESVTAYRRIWELFKKHEDLGGTIGTNRNVSCAGGTYGVYQENRPVDLMTLVVAGNDSSCDFMEAAGRELRLSRDDADNLDDGFLGTRDAAGPGYVAVGKKIAELVAAAATMKLLSAVSYL